MIRPGPLTAGLFLLVAGCEAGKEDAATETDAPTPAAGAGPASAPVAAVEPAYPMAGYEDLKVAAAEFAKGHDFTPQAVAAGELPPAAFDIFDCSEDYASQEVVEIDRNEAEAEALARRVALLEKRMRQEGYRPEIYKAPLLAYEKAVLALLGDAPAPAFGDDAYSAWEENLHRPFAALAERIEKKRAELQPDEVPIIQQGGCGASEAAFRITPQPDDGRVWMITQFAFDVCRVRRRDPWSLATCRWAEVRPERPAYLSGNYVYQAKWPGGAAGRGKVNLDGSFDEDGEPDTVAVRPD